MLISPVRGYKMSVPLVEIIKRKLLSRDFDAEKFHEGPTSRDHSYANMETLRLPVWIVTMMKQTVLSQFSVLLDFWDFWKWRNLTRQIRKNMIHVLSRIYSYTIRPKIGYLQTTTTYYLHRCYLKSENCQSTIIALRQYE